MQTQFELNYLRKNPCACLSHNHQKPGVNNMKIEVNPHYALGKIVYLFVLVIVPIFWLMACQTGTGTDTDQLGKVSTRYVLQTYSGPSCWYRNPLAPNDSLIVEKAHYTISNRSRYRHSELSLSQTKAIQKQAVIERDWAIYHDTKTDSIYVFNRCGGI